MKENPKKSDKVIESEIKSIIDNSNLFDTPIQYRESDLEHILRLSKDLYIYKDKHINQIDCAISILNIFDKHRKETSSKKTFNIADRDTFSELFDEQEKNEIKNEIKDFITSLPKRYEVNFIFPNISHSIKHTISHDKNIVFAFETPMYNKPIGMLNSFLATEKQNTNIIGYYLSIKINHVGYLTFNNVTEPLSILKQIIYLGVCLNILNINSTLIPNRRVNSDSIFGYISDKLNETQSTYRTQSGDQSEQIAIKLSDPEIDYIYQCEPKDSQHPSNIIDMINKLAEKFATLKSKHLNVEKNKILSSLELGMESSMQQNETIKFILKCMAIEAILGDRDNSEKSNQKLINRCAYQLGRTHDERQKLITDFPILYKLRSRLAHGNIVKLSHYDLDTVFLADDIHRRLLLSELSMIENSKIPNIQANIITKP